MSVSFARSLMTMAFVSTVLAIAPLSATAQSDDEKLYLSAREEMGITDYCLANKHIDSKQAEKRKRQLSIVAPSGVKGGDEREAQGRKGLMQISDDKYIEISAMAAGTGRTVAQICQERVTLN